MKLRFEIDPPLDKLFLEEFEAGERAVTRAMRRAGTGLKEDMRSEVVRAGLGQRLSKTIRSESYPKKGVSMDAAAWVYTNADKIIEAHWKGALIRSKGGFYLAIPTPAAGRGTRDSRLTPREWERRRGIKLRLVPRRTGPSLLVADDARINTRGAAVRKGGRRRKDGILTGAQTVPIFLLVPQIKLPARLDLDSAIRKWSGSRVSQMIVDEWVDQKFSGP